MKNTLKNVEPEGSPREAVAPYFVQCDRGFDVAQAVLGYLAEAPLGDHLGDIHARDAVAFGGVDAEGFAVKVEVETARGAIAAAIIEGELVCQVAMSVGLITIAEPVFAGDWHIQQG